MLIKLDPIWGYFCISDHNLIIVKEIGTWFRQKGIRKAYRNDKKDVDTREREKRRDQLYFRVL